MSTPAVVRAAVEAAFRDHAIVGVPASGDHEPLKSDIRMALGAVLESALASVGSGLAPYATVPLMEAVTTAADGALAYVYANNDDPADAANGVYQWMDGDGEWVTADWYYSAVAAVVQPLVDEAEAARDLAGQWASEAEDTEVAGGEFSAKHYAAKAAAGAAGVASTLGRVSEIRRDPSLRVSGGIDDVSGKLSFGVDIFQGTPVGGAIEWLFDRVREGLAFTPPGPNAHPVYALNAHVGGGQSNRNALQARPILSITPSPDHLMFAGGVVRPAAAGLASFVPLQSTDDGSHGETTYPIMAREIARRVGGGYPMLTYSWASDGTNIANLLKGTPAYTGMINASTAAVANSAAASPPISLAFQAFEFDHGEADEQAGTSRADYVTRMTQWLTDAVADHKALSGQTFDPKLFYTQVSSWSVYSRPQPTIPLAQIDFYDADPVNRILIGPTYYVDYVDPVHRENDSQRWIALQYAKVEYKVLGLGETWGPLRALSGFADTPYSIIMDFHVPSGPLVLDDVMVSDPGNYGFQVFDSDGEKTVTSVKTLGRNKVRLTVSTPLAATGREVRYACASVAGAGAGPQTGPRGCLRDSDPFLSDILSKDGRPHKLYNWCLHFKMVIP